MKVICNKSNPPIGGLLALELYRNAAKSVEIVWDGEPAVTLPNSTKALSYGTSNDLIRILENAFNKSASPLARLTMNHWLSFSLILDDEIPKSVEYLDKILGPLTYLVGESLSVSDLAVFSVLHVSNNFKDLTEKNPPKNVLRWMKLIQAQEPVAKALKELPAEVLEKSTKSMQRRSPNKEVNAAATKQEGKFVELPHAEMGKVVVRFPPEASGFLHIGHAKAALLNQYYQKAFDGLLIMRFDDTNPAKENAEFEKVILRDVEMLEIKPDRFTHTSQYFDMMLEFCEKLIKEGKAFVDDTPAEQMKIEREQKIESKNRNNSVEKNLQLWEEMKLGTATGTRNCVRAKIDMQSTNGCLRDPTIYRCKPEAHPRTGTKYKVYPTYDFACPIVDSVEGVTHVLRTMEYHDRDPQFYWFIDALGLRKPYIWEYSRLSMTNTVLSKRKLTWFVDQGLVDGWDDPRMPTVRGVLRRGMTVEGLRQFITAQGSSRSVVFMEWDKIWAINKKVIDPIAPRYTALEAAPVRVNLKGDVAESKMVVPLHPKNPAVGNKTVLVSPHMLIDEADAKLLKEGENATFINYGNVKIDKIHRSSNGKITSIDATPNLEDKDYKKTLKLTWLANTSTTPLLSVYCVYFDHLISKPLLAKDEDFKQYVGHQTRWEVRMMGEPALCKVREGDIIQLQRRGFFRVDVPPLSRSPHGCLPRALVLFHVPEGHTKEIPGHPKYSQPGPVVQPAPVPVQPADPLKLHEEILKQGESVRSLKATNADKATINSAVQLLLRLKAQYKSATGKEWRPDGIHTSLQPTAPTLSELLTTLNKQIARQSDLVRALKASNAHQTRIDEALQGLLELKKKFNAASEQKTPKEAESGSSGLNQVADVLKQISVQGDKIRKLKAEKADKGTIDTEVKNLLNLKAQYKALTGTDWTPNAVPPPTKTADQNAQKAAEGSENQVADVLKQISVQGDKIRKLKAEKADKGTIDTEVKNLLNLKAQYKALTGTDWTPNAVPPPTKTADQNVQKAAEGSEHQVADVLKQISVQGDKIRKLKADKADKGTIDTEVKNLLNLKAQYKALTGTDWTPNAVSPSVTKTSDKGPASSSTMSAATPTTTTASNGEEIAAKVKAQGDLVRELKTKKADKAGIDAEVKKLLALKAQYKEETGTEYPIFPQAKPKDAPSKDAAPKDVAPKDAKPKDAKPKEAKSKEKKDKPKEAKPKEQSPKLAKEESSSGVKKITRLGLEACKETDLPEWYSQVITKSEMIDYYDISGCYILRPWSYSIWDAIRTFLSTNFKKIGVKDGYFPIFVSKAALEREKTHIADFAPEVAWVTHSGSSELAEHIAVRPTSETVMYPAYAKWVQSHRDLPLRLNQWNNVVRWEFKQPQPFLRTREFLWQEGHTAFRTAEEAGEEVLHILDLYRQVYEDLLAIPVIRGRKTEKEKFAGSAYTTTVEAYIPASGRGIQGATSHHLGQNFSKMFEIIYDDPDTQEKKYVYQNSWGLTTRTIGVMVLVHGDNRGLVLPPRVAEIQAIVVPCGITASSTPEERKNLIDSCKALVSDLVAAGIRAEGDYRDNYSPGWKFNHWELKGVPIRVELGPKDISRGEIVAVRRLTGAKLTLKRDSAAKDLIDLLETTHKEMLAKATKERDERVSHVTKWEDFTEALERRHILLAPFCGDPPCEDNIKNDSARTDDDPTAEVKGPAMGAKSLCIPFDQPRPLTDTDRCIHPTCNNKPKFITLFGRSY